MQCFIFEENFCEGGKQRIRANTTFQSLSNWTTMEKTVGQISAFSKEDSVHYYTPGGYYSLTYQTTWGQFYHREAERVTLHII